MRNFIRIGIFGGILLCHFSCRSTDSDNIVHSAQGITAVNINLLGTSFNEEGMSTSQASMGKEQVKITKRNIFIDPVTIITAELSPSPNSLKMLAQAPSTIKSTAVINGSSLGNGIKFRVIAYRQSDGLYETHQDYINGKAATSMMLNGGVAYTMVAYSYGTSTLPEIRIEEKSDINKAFVDYDDVNRDFSYQKISFTPDMSKSNNILDITLRHKVALINTIISSPNVDISSINNASLSSLHSATSTFNLSNGEITRQKENLTKQAMSFTNKFPGKIATASPVFINTDTKKSKTGSISFDIAIAGTTKTISLSDEFSITPGTNSNLNINLLASGAYVGANNTIWKKFLPYNLGADPNADFTKISADVSGAVYQYGALTSEQGRYYSQSDNQSNHTGIMPGWNSNVKPVDSWGAPKTANDPCPSGYRIPKVSEWKGLVNNIMIVRSNSAGFQATLPGETRISPESSDPYAKGVKLQGLLLPLAGARDDIYIENDKYYPRGLGLSGSYWAIDDITQSPYKPQYFVITIATSFNYKQITDVILSASALKPYQTYGASVRCIEE